MKNIKLNLKNKIDSSYEIIFSEKPWVDLSDFLIDKWIKRVLIVCDENIFKYQYENLLKEIDKKIEIKNIVLKPWEENKKIESVLKIIDKLVDIWFNRNDYIVAFWWGVIWDMVWFAASIYKRWIDFIQIPTTLLSIFDSSVWWKTGVDYKDIKNIIGVFKQPKLVLINKNYLKTLDKKEILSWYFEWLKHSIIDSKKHYDYFKTNSKTLLEDIDDKKINEILRKSISLKARIVEQDEKESWVRKFLNYGHTFWHALESVSNYQISHGVCVAYGMIFENLLSNKLLFLDKKNCQDINNFIIRLLKDEKLKKLNFEKILEKMKSDKKNTSSKISFSIAKNIWDFQVVEIWEKDFSILKEVYEDFYILLNKKEAITITLPWSKSITNRDLILASLSKQESILESFLESDDTNYMIKALKKLWVKIERKKDKLKIKWWVEKLEGDKIYVWQSGTCMRFLTWLAILNKKSHIEISWEKRLMERPIRELIKWIEDLWVKIESNKLKAPLKIYPSDIKNTKIKMNWNSSSQFFTSLLQIWWKLENWLEIEVEGDLVSKPYIDITINEMKKFWVEVENQKYKYFKVKKQKYTAQKIKIEWDASALSYIANFVVLNSKKVEIDNLWKNTFQWDYNYLDKLKIFWIKYIWLDDKTILDHKATKDIFIDELKEIDFEDMPDVSMSFMSLAIFIKWNTKITWIQTLNLKECKRIDAMRDELSKLWVVCKSDEKSIVIWEFSKEKFEKIIKEKKQIDIETYNDHRIAMVFWILNSYLWNLNILNPDCVNKTYPNFWKDLEKLKN